MAKKKQKLELENIELKPQVLGRSYVKKSNLGRIIFIFICFILVVYYINDISVFINNLLGKQTAETIVNNTNKDKDKHEEEAPKEIIYNIYSPDLIISEAGLVISDFNYSNNVITFNARNDNVNVIDLSNKKYFLEVYTEDKTLIDRRKLDFGRVNSGAKVSFSFDIIGNIYYIVIIEKSVEDYPRTNYVADGNGYKNITCNKGMEEITYKFSNDELNLITHTIRDDNMNEQDYADRVIKYQNLVNSYSNKEGITASFNSTNTGYVAVISITAEALQKYNIKDVYYFSQGENINVVNFEMQTYGFTCQ